MNDMVYEEQKQLIKMWKQKYYDEKQELERYKNIIDELEKYLKEENKFDEYKDITYRETMGYVLDKLKELKGSDE